MLTWGRLWLLCKQFVFSSNLSGPSRRSSRPGGLGVLSAAGRSPRDLERGSPLLAALPGLAGLCQSCEEKQKRCLVLLTCHGEGTSVPGDGVLAWGALGGRHRSRLLQQAPRPGRRAAFAAPFSSERADAVVMQNTLGFCFCCR